MDAATRQISSSWPWGSLTEERNWPWKGSSRKELWSGWNHKHSRRPMCMDRRGNPSWAGAEVSSSPDSQVDALVASLRACTKSKDLGRGSHLHDDLLQMGLLDKCSDALVTMYAKCGELSKAKRLLDMHKSSDVITWTSLIAGYARMGQGRNALDCFEQMQHEGVLPNVVTYACILKACANIGALDMGNQIHNAIAEQGLLQNNLVLGNALVDMYAKCGDLSMAQRVLEELPARDVISWSTLIAGYTQHGQADQALGCFEQMQHEGIFPNAVTYTCILKACGIIGAIDKGKQIHDEIVRQGLLPCDIVLGGALVDMYAKCGDLYMARLVLKELPSRNVVLWSALIAGYAQKGQAKHVLSCFEQMQQEGILPDAVTFSCVLNVCSHLGLVEEGEALFLKMRTKYDVKPDLECYTCMVDLLGRAGHLEKAARLILEMPSSDYSIIWFALLGACQKWVDVHVGRWAFEQAVQLDVSDGPAYILMANIYAAAGMQEKARSIEVMRKRNRAYRSVGVTVASN